jgi:diaminohydroxyphosphoribosylaminopyrimidine deaminase/5-amino-6-(5-phosphoribosylamino)uracil reductase
VGAIASARRRAGDAALRRASLAVTLEPCNHTGRTPPCVDAILEAGIGRVFVGCRDPHKLVAGRGLRRLRARGVRVERLLESECRDQLRGFFSVHERGRPWLELKLASTLDGRIATASGESRWITGEAARREVHRLRARVDAVLVGSGTALADDPALTARHGDRIVHAPVRVLVDSRLRVPATAQLYREERGESWVLCAHGAGTARARRALEARGARLLEVGRRGERGLDLRAALRRLAAEGLTHVLLEGGGELAAAFLRAKLIDEVHWMIAPKLLGGDARPALGPLALRRLADSAILSDVRVRRLGEDIALHARLSGSR